MKPTGRTQKEVAGIIAKTISRIRRHKIITDEIIKRQCKRNKISEKAIRTIAGMLEPGRKYDDE